MRLIATRFIESKSPGNGGDDAAKANLEEDLASNATSIGILTERRLRAYGRNDKWQLATLDADDCGQTPIWSPANKKSFQMMRDSGMGFCGSRRQ